MQLFTLKAEYLSKLLGDPPPFVDLWLQECNAGQVAAMKLFTLKADYVGVLLYSLYRVSQVANATSTAVGSTNTLQVRRDI